MKAGSYLFTITDASGCTKDTNIVIKQGDELLVTTNVTDITCYGADNGEIEIIASGGTPAVIPPEYMYSIDSANTWFPGNMFGSLPQDTFYIAVQDSVGCVVFADTIEMLYPDTISIDSVKVIPTTCNGGGSDGQIVVFTSGGVGAIGISTDGITYQYGNDTIKGLPVGDTTIYVQDNCETKMLDSLVTITGPVPIEIDSVVVADVNTCFGGSTGQITVYARGGTGNYTYLLDGTPNSPPDDNIFTGLSSGIYTVSVLDNNGCYGPDSIAVVDQPSQVMISSYTVIHTSECNTPQDVGEIFINGSGGTPPYRYALVSGSDSITQGLQPFENLAPGNYRLYVIDYNECTTSALDTSIVLNPGMSISMNSIDIRCNGENNGEASVNITNGVFAYTYSWEGPDGFTSADDTIRNLKAGTYYVTVTDSNSPNNCIENDSIKITEPSALSVVLNSKDVYCVGANNDPIDSQQAKGYINPGVTGGTPLYNYEWTGPGSFSSTDEYISGLDAGTYSLKVTDSKSCEITANVTIEEDDEYDITNTQITFEDTLVCWHDPVSFTANFEGITSGIRIQAVNLEKSTSNPEYFIVDNISPYNGEYHFMSGDTRFEIITFSNDYCMSRIVANDTVKYVHNFDLEIIDTEGPENDTIILKGSTQTQLTATVAEDASVSFDWFYPSVERFSSPYSQTTVVSPEESGWFGVAASSVEGCADTTIVYIEFIPAITPNEAFSPNDDGINDYWRIKFIDQFPNNTVMVFNRWGLKVFEQKGYTNDDESKAWGAAETRPWYGWPETPD